MSLTSVTVRDDTHLHGELRKSSTFFDAFISQKLKIAAVEQHADTEQMSTTIHFSSDVSSILKGLRLTPSSTKHIVVESMTTADRHVRSLMPIRDHKTQLNLLAQALSTRKSRATPYEIHFLDGSLEYIVANAVDANSISTVVDLTDLWFVDTPAGYDKMKALLLQCLSADAVLYTSMATMFNSWMRLLGHCGCKNPWREFVETRFEFEGSPIYKIAIRKALEPNDTSQTLMEILGLVEANHTSEQTESTDQPSIAQNVGPLAGCLELNGTQRAAQENKSHL